MSTLGSKRPSYWFAEDFERSADLLKLLERNVRVNSHSNGRSTGLSGSEFNIVGTGQVARNGHRPIVSLPELPAFPSARGRTFQKLQEWEGYVVGIGPEEFTARLIDLTRGSSQAEEEATFPVSDLTDDDRSMLREGAVFRWIIGYQREGKGPKQRVSQIVFRRVPAWTNRDFARADRYADELEDAIEWR
jgi:hypothetical protein